MLGYVSGISYFELVLKRVNIMNNNIIKVLLINNNHI